MKAVLALEDGTIYRGTSIGAQGETRGEVVFNTSMTGYQEVLTDPSYAGQIVTMTSPQIGNYGVSGEDVESQAPAGGRLRRPRVVAGRQQLARRSAAQRLSARQQHRRDRGHRHARAHAQAALGRRAPRRSSRRASPMARRWRIGRGRSRRWKAPTLCARSPARPRIDWPAAGDDAHEDFRVPPERRAKKRLTIAAYDFGIKLNILRRLAAHNCDVRVFPATAPASDLLAASPDGIFLSNGPGDPAALPYVIDNVKQLVASEVPVFGICLGHQVLGLAMGGNTFKLKFGHRGGNQPVKNLATGKVEITSQNHGFAVDPESLPGHVRVTHLNLYDGTVEGLRHVDKRVFCVQYHPEASPGTARRGLSVPSVP